MRTFYFLIALCSLASCSTDAGDLCERTFEPYPDMVSGRERNIVNAAYLDGMQHYAKGEYAEAIPLLKEHIARVITEPSPLLYLAICHLALGQPYEAELELDHLEQLPNQGMRDQAEWYNVVCMLCSDQNDRALQQAEAIVARKQHTYIQQAQDVIKMLK